jgi:hypothetical protein
MAKGAGNFARLGLPIESAVLLLLVAAALMMRLSLSGALLYVLRGRAFPGSATTPTTQS